MPNNRIPDPTIKPTLPANTLCDSSRSSCICYFHMKIENIEKAIINQKIIVIRNELGIQKSNGLIKRTKRIIMIEETNISCKKLFFINNIYILINYLILNTSSTVFLKNLAIFNAKSTEGV